MEATKMVKCFTPKPCMIAGCERMCKKLKNKRRCALHYNIYLREMYVMENLANEDEDKIEEENEKMLRRNRHLKGLETDDSISPYNSDDSFKKRCDESSSDSDNDPTFVPGTPKPKVKPSLLKKRESTAKVTPPPSSLGLNDKKPKVNVRVKRQKTQSKRNQLTKNATKETQDSSLEIITKQIDSDLLLAEESECVTNERKKNLSIGNSYKGDVNYCPGVPFQPKISSCNLCKEDKGELLRLVKRQMEKISEQLVQKFGNLDAVTPYTDTQKDIRYLITCPEDGCHSKMRDIDNHLTRIHKWEKRNASLQRQVTQRTYSYLTRINKKSQNKPAICPDCCVCEVRMGRHLENVHHLKSGTVEYKNRLAKCTNITNRYVFDANVRKINLKNFNEGERDEVAVKKHSEVRTATATKDKRIPDEHVDMPMSGHSREGENKKISLRAPASAVTALKHVPRRKILLSALFLTSTLKKKFDIESEHFQYFYQSSMEILDDFERWFTMKATGKNSNKTARQHRNQVEEIWFDVDEKKCLHPNLLSSANHVEDYYFYPRFATIKSALHLPIEQRPKHMQAGTLRSRLTSLKIFLTFLTTRNVYAGMTLVQINLLREKLKVMNSQLNNLINQRNEELKEWKSETLITPKDILAYCQSDYVQGLIQKMKEISSRKECSLSTNEIAEVRNYLMVILTWSNALRPSNIINMTISDFDAAKPHAECKGAYELISRKYKTSLIYGSKTILLSKELYLQLQCFIDHMRPHVRKDEHLPASSRNIFCTRDNSEISSSLISNGFSRSFQYAKVYTNKNDCDRVSPHRIRASVATELASTGEANLEVLANSFMKHTVAVSKQFYIQNWANQQATMFAMKCYGFTTPTKEEMELGDKKRELLKCKVASAGHVRKWLKATKQKVAAKTGENYEDKQLEEVLVEIMTKNGEDAEEESEEELAEEPPKKTSKKLKVVEEESCQEPSEPLEKKSKLVQDEKETEVITKKYTFRQRATKKEKVFEHDDSDNEESSSSMSDDGNSDNSGSNTSAGTNELVLRQFDDIREKFTVKQKINTKQIENAEIKEKHSEESKQNEPDNQIEPEKSTSTKKDDNDSILDNQIEPEKSTPTKKDDNDSILENVYVGSSDEEEDIGVAIKPGLVEAEVMITHDSNDPTSPDFKVKSPTKAAGLIDDLIPVQSTKVKKKLLMRPKEEAMDKNSEEDEPKKKVKKADIPKPEEPSLPDDWYVSVKYNRSVILQLLLAVAPYISSEYGPKISLLNERIAKLASRGMKVDALNMLTNAQKRDVCKAMCRRHKKETDMTSYNKFLEEAKDMYLKDLS